MKETAYLLQAALIASWWVGLACSERFFSAFQFPRIGPEAFWSFCGPDIFVIAALSLLRAYKSVRAFEWVVLGGFAYAALYCVNATLLTGGGYLSTTLMLIGLSYNVFLCFNKESFRPSVTQNAKANGMKTLVQIVCIWLIALVVIPFIILDAFSSLALPASGLNLIAGVVLFLLFSTLGLTSAVFMVIKGGGTPLPLDQTNQLVTAGPYRYVRNPMAIAGIGQGLSISLAFLSVPILVYSMLGVCVWHLVVRPMEERDMIGRFGDAFRKYKNEVPCWLPRLKRNAD